MKRNNEKLLRLLVTAVVVAGMLVSLTACANAPAETVPQSKPAATKPAATQSPESTPPEPVVTESPESTPPEPVVTEALNIDYDNLITDAYGYLYRDEYGYEYCYHIPQVNLESCASFNEEIHRTLTEIMETDVHEPIREYGMPMVGDLFYIWNHKDEVVSILITIANADIDNVGFRAYYLSTETGKQLGKADLLRTYGLSEEQFHDKVESALNNYWDRLLSDGWHLQNDDTKKMVEDLKSQTLAVENISAALPYISAEGRLSFTVTLYVPAGGGEYQALFDYETEEELFQFDCMADHSDLN